MKNSYFILFIFLLFGCNSATQTNQPTDLEYKFYSLTLDSLFESEKTIVLRDSIVIPFRDDEITGPTLTANANDLVAKFPIAKSELHITPNVSLLSYSSLVEIMKRENGSMWDNFYAKFPGSAGWLVLSTVSYNEDSTQANLFLNHGCERYCGGEYEIIFEKQNGDWKLAYLMEIAVP